MGPFFDSPDGDVTVTVGILLSVASPVPSFPCCDDGETLGVICSLLSDTENLWMRVFTLPDRVRFVAFINDAFTLALQFFFSSSALLLVTSTCPFESMSVFFGLRNMSLLSVS